jgi:hypothetical protein
VDRDLMRVAAGMMVGVGVVAALAACGGNDVHNDGAVGSLPSPRAPEPTSVIVTSPAVPARPAVNVWRAAGLKEALDALQRAAGGRLLLTQVVLYPTYAIAEARNPRRPADVDRYVFRAGVVDTPSPVTIVGTRNLDAETFTREEVAFAQVPALVRSAPAQLGIEGARATHVIIERDTVFAAGEVVIRVDGGTARRSGYVEYDARAKLRKVVQ